MAGYYGFTLVVCESVRLSIRRTSVPSSVCFSFPDDNLSKWIFTKLGMCIDIVEIWFGIANEQISSIFEAVISPRHAHFRFRTITWVNNKGFSPNLLYALTLRRSGLGLLWANFVKFLRSHLPKTCPYFRFRMITWVNYKEFSSNLLYALTLRRSSLGLLMGKFRKMFTELSARDTPIFLFPDDNFSK